MARFTRLNESFDVVELGGETVELFCSIGVIEKICAKYGGFDAFWEATSKLDTAISAVPYALTQMINEAATYHNYYDGSNIPMADEWEIKTHISYGEMWEWMAVVNNQIAKSLGISENDFDEVGEKNALAAPTEKKSIRTRLRGLFT